MRLENPKFTKFLVDKKDLVPLKGTPIKLHHKVKCPTYELGSEKEHLLIVVDKVHMDDLKNGHMFTKSPWSKIMSNVLTYAEQEVGGSKFGKITIVQWSCINYRTDTIDENIRQAIRKAQATRLNKIVEYIKPSMILCYAHDPIKHYDFSKLEKGCNIFYENGRVRPVKYGNTKVPTVFSYRWSFAATTDDDYLKTRPPLLGFLAKAAECALLGKNRYTINPEVNVIKVLTLKDFDKFFDKLKKSKIPAFDTETHDLNRLNPRLISMQVVLDRTDECWFIPFEHTESPWTSKEITIIKKKIFKYLSGGKSNYHIMHNGSFDALIMRQYFGVRFYAHRIYDTMAGEFILDENRKIIREHDQEVWDKERAGAYTLQRLTYEYGSRVYASSPIEKGDRSRMADFKLDDIATYGCIDSVVTRLIHDCQIKEAERRGYSLFVRTVADLMGDMTHCFVEYESNGINIDLKYLYQQMNNNTSTFTKTIDDLLAEFKSSPHVKDANSILLKERGYSEKQNFMGMKREAPFVLDLQKHAHRCLLFFDLMKLEATNIRADGTGSIDKHFQQQYQNIKEVSLFSQYVKSRKLRDTYINGIYKQLKDNPESIDGRLRAHYGYVGVLTGRSSVSKPAFQQLPQHGPMAKYIKREFIAPKGMLIVKNDYSAHEVRMWGNIAGDNVIAKSFRQGTKLRYKLRIATDSKLKEEIAKELGIKGDIHKINASFFFAIPVEKVTKEIRQGVKQVVFGVIYGKGARSLAVDLSNSQEYAQDLIDKLFTTFEKGGLWLKDTIKLCRKELKVESPVGVVRHLWGYLHTDRSVHGMMDRRGPNSMIQGLSSQIGYIAGRNMQKMANAWFWSKNLPFLFQSINAVHDSSFNYCHFIETPMMLYIIEHAFTTEVHRRCKDVYGFNINCGLEIEIDMGCSDSQLQGWHEPVDINGKVLEKAEADSKIKIHGWSKERMLHIVDESIDWANKELGYDLNKNRLMKDVSYNADIVFDIRDKELKKIVKSDEAPLTRLISSDNIESLNLRLVYDQQRYFNKE